MEAALDGVERQTEITVATIGAFTTDRDGFLTGQIRTLDLHATVSMEPVNSDRKGACLPALRG